MIEFFKKVYEKHKKYIYIQNLMNYQYRYYKIKINIFWRKFEKVVKFIRNNKINKNYNYYSESNPDIKELLSDS